MKNRQDTQQQVQRQDNNRVGSVVTVKLKIYLSNEEEENVAKEHERQIIKHVQQISITAAGKHGDARKV